MQTIRKSVAVWWRFASLSPTARAYFDALVKIERVKRGMRALGASCEDIVAYDSMLTRWAPGLVLEVGDAILYHLRQDRPFMVPADLTAIEAVLREPRGRREAGMPAGEGSDE